MQYAKDFTDALQFMWGEGFLSPGGPEEVTQMVAGHDIAGKRVLDIGSGLGGVDALLVERHGAGEVIGIDVEPQLIEAANVLIAKKNLSARITFKLVEPGPLPFEDGSFDVVFSKDAMVHIDDKPSLFVEILRVLKSGCAFIAADWLWSEDAGSSAVVQAWLSKGPLKFAFTTPAQARQSLRHAGFKDIEINDLSSLLRASNRREVEALEGPVHQRLAAVVGDEMAMKRLASARGRQGALDSGDLIPSHLKARKPG